MALVKINFNGEIREVETDYVMKSDSLSMNKLGQSVGLARLVPRPIKGWRFVETVGNQGFIAIKDYTDFSD